MDVVLSTFIPYHQTGEFVRLVQVMPSTVGQSRTTPASKIFGVFHRCDCLTPMCPDILRMPCADMSPGGLALAVPGGNEGERRSAAERCSGAALPAGSCRSQGHLRGCSGVRAITSIQTRPARWRQVRACCHDEGYVSPSRREPQGCGSGLSSLHHGGPHTPNSRPVSHVAARLRRV